MLVSRRRVGHVFVVLSLVMVWLTPMASQTALATEFTQTHSDTIPLTTTNFTIPVELPQFDPMLGDLLEVTLAMEAEVDSTMQVENLSTSSDCDATLQWGADMTVQADVGDLAITPVDSENVLLDVYDGVTDFAGPSGASFASLTAGSSDVFSFTDPADLVAFIGTGVLTTPVSAQGLTTVTGCGTIAQLITTLASATVTVTYRYDASPEIDIEKATNGEDADNPTGPEIPVGDPVTWTYVVTNTGNVALSNVSVTDDQGVVVSCPQDTLAVDESMTCTGNGTAEAGQYANVGTTSGEGPNGQVVMDEDPSHYFGVTPAIDIEKATNGNDADDPNGVDVPVVQPGDPVTWTYVVTNTGNAGIAEADIDVTDDVLGTITDIVDKGDGDAVLDPGESWTYEAIAPDGAADLEAPPPGTPVVSGCNAAGEPGADRATYENIGMVEVPGASDTDPSHYCNPPGGGVDPMPAIDIEKATNGEDADDPTGPEIPVGDPVTWTYVVTNTGNVDLSNVGVVDDQGVTVTCPQDTLAVDESMTCTGNGTAEAGQYANLGTTEGTAPDGTIVTDEDPSHYIGVVPDAPAIDIEKATNGEDADDPTGPEIPVGDPVTWTYVVTNTGNVDLSNVGVVDDQGVTVTCPQDTLAVDESMTCTGNGTAELGQYANLGTTEGTAPDGTIVTDEDPSHYIGVELPDVPAIDIEKATNGHDADTPTGPWIGVGDPVTWTYVVTNTGSVPLSGVSVVDDHRVDITCPQDTLDVGESMTCTGPGIAQLGQYGNVGTTEGTAPNGTIVTDQDPSHYYGYMVKVWLDCSHGDVGCLGVAGQAPGQVTVLIDGVEYGCDGWWDPASNTSRFHCMVDSTLLNDTVTVEIYVDGVLMWSGTGIPAQCDLLPDDPDAGSSDGENTTEAVREERPKAVTDRNKKADNSDAHG